MTAARFDITWHDAGREPKAWPDPAYPNGIDFDASRGAERTCEALLPYPAKRCGYYLVSCPRCGLQVAITTAGRRDDPRSVKMACQINGDAA